MGLMRQSKSTESQRSQARCAFNLVEPALCYTPLQTEGLKQRSRRHVEAFLTFERTLTCTKPSFRRN